MNKVDYMTENTPPGYKIVQKMPDIVSNGTVIHQGVILVNGNQRVLRWRENGVLVCGAKRHGREERCLLNPLAGKTRCKLHGGKSTGPRKYLETRLPNKILERAAQLRKDPETMSGKGDLAVAAAQVERLLTTGAAIEERFKEIRDTWDRLEKARLDGDGEAVVKLMNVLRDQFKASESLHVDSGELIEWLDLRRKMLETERKALSGDSITVDDVRLLMVRIMRAIEVHVPDKQVIRNIAAEVGLLKGPVIEVERTDVGKNRD